MGWSHRTVGYEYEAVRKLFLLVGIDYVELEREWRRGHPIWEDGQPLRKLAFVHPGNGRHVLIEEYVAVRDLDCDGESRIVIAIYSPGQRPPLESLTQEKRP